MLLEHEVIDTLYGLMWLFPLMPLSPLAKGRLVSVSRLRDLKASVRFSLTRADPPNAPQGREDSPPKRLDPVFPSRAARPPSGWVSPFGAFGAPLRSCFVFSLLLLKGLNAPCGARLHFDGLKILAPVKMLSCQRETPFGIP